MDWQVEVAEARSRVDRRLAELLPAGDSKLEQAMRYSALGPGKRLRPILCLESARAAGVEECLDAACALEFLHCFSLIHDDLPAIDDDATRRGRPTCHIEFGEAVAILAGDALFALVFEVLAGLDRPANRVVKAIRELSVASGTGGLVGGETLDILSEGMDLSHEAAEATLRKIHDQKTGALIVCACRMGAVLGGAGAGEIEALGEYGKHVGHAFQIADDILNETSSAETLGKSVGSDRERGKLTYPALFGLERSQQMAEEACEDAKKALAGLPGETSVLMALADYAIKRAH